ncbi:YihY family inner membrane protein [Marinospirillum alkaliphilum]|uniref:UPF0761 membrane protein SAMN02745752_01948 n=1 Tax=Marinospirillum alkaliphilum DSM 21637 TaxID=1122209 RepID=A0A1K1XNK1_9GAMM|nr:YihY family inner membrane protein [Marinospirillum alkaliphilum]SFX51297.1 tRNA-processing RNAse BN [Marinospirillum alkaliphilum DSM 21637]
MQQPLQQLRSLAKLRGIAFALRVIRRFISDESPRNAAALTYTSLFAVVPLLTVTYSMLAALPAFRDVGEQLQGMVFDHMVPATGVVIQDYMGSFAQQARQLTLVGVAFLIITAGMMIVNIEKAFNAIWRVEKPRRGLQAFLIYWTVLTLGPLLLGAGMVLSSYLASLPLLEQITGFAGGTATLLGYMPFVLSILAFTLLYWAVPHCKVRLRDAAMGGTAMALLFETAKKGFTWFVSSFPSYELVYGAFAAFPLFLLWIYVSWLLILLCAEWVAVRGLPEEQVGEENLEPAVQMLVVLVELWQAFARGEGVEENRLRSLSCSQNPVLWQQRMEWLQSHQWIAFDADRQVWLPGRDYSRIRFADWLQSLPWKLPPVASWPENLQQLQHLSACHQALEQQERSLFDKPVSHYLDTDKKDLERTS